MGIVHALLAVVALASEGKAIAPAPVEREPAKPVAAFVAPDHAFSARFPVAPEHVDDEWRVERDGKTWSVMAGPSQGDMTAQAEYMFEMWVQQELARVGEPGANNIIADERSTYEGRPSVYYVVEGTLPGQASTKRTGRLLLGEKHIVFVTYSAPSDAWRKDEGDAFVSSVHAPAAD